MFVVSATITVTTASPTRQPEPEHRGASDDRPTADALGTPVRDRATDFLLEREEEAGREDEDEDPERVQRGVVGLAERAEREDLEDVGGDTAHEQTGADGEGAFRKRSAGGFDQPLGALGHASVFS